MTVIFIGVSDTRLSVIHYLKEKANGVYCLIKNLCKLQLLNFRGKQIVLSVLCLFCSEQVECNYHCIMKENLP